MSEQLCSYKQKGGILMKRSFVLSGGLGLMTLALASAAVVSAWARQAVN